MIKGINLSLKSEAQQGKNFPTPREMNFLRYKSQISRGQVGFLITLRLRLLIKITKVYSRLFCIEGEVDFLNIL